MPLEDDGDPSPRELFSVFYPRLAGWTARLVDDHEVAHEIASEAFIRLLPRWAEVREPRSWLFMTAGNLARAAIEGMLCGLADGLDALAGQGVGVGAVQLIGGAAQSEAVRRIAPTVFGVPVRVPAPGEYVADGAARQAAWVLAGSAEPPTWQRPDPDRFDAPLTAGLRQRYAAAAGKYLNR